MLMLNEFKKNVGFFLLMALVLMLIMSAGVSVFNFSFEISEEINKEIAEHFEYGYELYIEEYIDPVSQRLPGVDYYTYYAGSKVLYPLPEGYPYDEEAIDEEVERKYPIWLNTSVFYFEDYLPKNFLRTNRENSNFIVSGRLWEMTDNYKTDGKYPIFLSDSIVDYFKESGKELTVGDTLSIMDYIYDDENNLIEGKVLDFVVKGIYRHDSLDDEYQVNLPWSVIPLNAELECRAFFNEKVGQEKTLAIINDPKSFKEFMNFADKNKISYSSFIKEDMKLISLFTSVFIVIAVAVLTLSGFIAFVYCGMLINKRLNFIGLIKALGLSDYKIAKQFFGLLLIVFLFSFIAGNIFSIFLTSHFANLALTLFEYELNIGFNWFSQALFGLLTAVTVLINAVFLYRRIKKISIANVLTQKE